MSSLDKKYAELLIHTGINIQEGQTLIIHADPIHFEFATLLAEVAYQRGARRVVVKYASEHLQRLDYLYQSVEDLSKIRQWEIDEYDDFLSENLVRLALRSPNPGLMNDVSSDKVLAHSKARGVVTERYMHYSMSNHGQWLVCAYPTIVWAKAVFPDLSDSVAYDKLYDTILDACRVSVDNSPEELWENHNAALSHQNKVLNDYRFTSLRFTSDNGTDVVVGLVDNHEWCGGRDTSIRGVSFNPNMPTEESFTTPDRLRVDGIVYNALPLNNNGRIIDDFWLRFENGKVVDSDAKVGKEALNALLNTDENSSYLGEIALVSYDSPISNTGLLFYNTLFDENASCHMALGRGYPLIPGGEAMSKEELIQVGVNQSMLHVDFMFGTADMKVVGILPDGKEIVIMTEGNLVL